MNFSQLNLADVLIKSVVEQGYDQPSAIQEKSIPAVLAGKDLMGTCSK